MWPVSKQCKEGILTRTDKRNQDYNENWKEELSAYDEQCRRREREYLKHHLVISQAGSKELTKEENEVLVLYLNGVSCKDIADQHEVEVEVVMGLLEVIRGKLSVS